MFSLIFCFYYIRVNSFVQAFFICKIFEKCLYERIYSYLNKNKILTPVQFGFKQNSSTSDAVRQLFDNFAENIDK